ncbi:MAG: hypothetical protein GEV08_13125 [Acidimicrobiia bacterium]|nr:hypothetical protein [Acidimicrobiia bacterium]
MLGSLGRDVLDEGVHDVTVATGGLEGLARATGADAAALVAVDEDGTTTAVHEWRTARPSAWGVEVLPALPPGEATAHRWGGKLAARLGVAGVSVVPVTAPDRGRASWAVVLGWPDRARIWDEGWVPMLTGAGALLVGAEHLAAAAARPAVDESSGVANRKLFLVLAGSMLARLDRERGAGVAVLACQAAVPVIRPAGVAAEVPSGGVLDAAAMAGRLEGHLRESDLVGQFDERTVVLACEGVASPEDALGLAARLAAATGPRPPLAAAFVGRAGSAVGEAQAAALNWGVVHTSVRVAPGVLLRRADTAAYQAAVTGDGVALAEV